MSTRRSLGGWLRELAASDLSEVREHDHPVRGLVVFLVELPATFALAVRGLVYFAVATVAHEIRTAGRVTWTDADEPVLRWSWTGPGFEHAHQGRWELRAAGVACLVAGAFILELISQFPLSGQQRVLLYVTAGALALDPAWAAVYIRKQNSSRGSDPET